MLTKADKLKRGTQQATLLSCKKFLTEEGFDASIQTFSSLSKTGLEQLVDKLNHWLQLPPASAEARTGLTQAERQSAPTPNDKKTPDHKDQVKRNRIGEAGPNQPAQKAEQAAPNHSANRKDSPLIKNNPATKSKHTR